VGAIEPKPRPRKRRPSNRPEARVVLLYAAAILLSALVLAPILKSGFIGDDAFNSSRWSRTTMSIQGTSIIDTAVADQESWIVGQGRFFPLSSYVYALFYVVDGRVELFKFLIFAIVLLDLSLLADLARRLSGSVAVSVLVLVMAPLALQFRSVSFHDPTLGFAGVLPILFALVAGSLVLLCIYLERGQRRFLVASLVLYGLGLLMYEITIALFPLHLLVAWFYPRRDSFRSSLRTTLPFAGLATGAAAIAVGLRLYYGRALTRTAAEFAKGVAAGADMSAGAYAPNLDPAAVLTTLAKQVVAAVPLSYHLVETTTQSWASGFAADISQSPKGGVILVGAYVVMTALISIQVRRETASGSRVGLAAPLCVGVGLVVLPQVLIALSPRYQIEVFWGVGYLPVFFGYLGMGMVLSVAIYWLLGLAASKGRVYLVGAAILAAAAISYVGVVTFYDNQAVVELNNRASLYPRTILSDALSRGLVQGMPVGAELVIDSPLPWESLSYFESGSGRVVGEAIPTSALVQSLPSGTSTTTAGDGSATYVLAASSQMYLVSCRGYWPDNGFAAFGRIRRVVVRPGQPSTIDLEQVRLYTSDTPRPAGQTVVPKMPQLGLPVIDPGGIGFSSVGLARISSGPHWSMLQALPGRSIEIKR